jgi:Fur family ferric uptake transcriptional regulator
MASTLGREEKDVLTAHLARHGLKRSAQREVILEAFLKTGRHVSVEELLRIVRRRRADIGRTTIYRSLKLFKDAGLASELTYGGEARFETLWNRDHHDHFICGSCGEIFEFKSPEIEQIQETIARGIGFQIEAHRHHILGLCRKCVAKASSSSRSSSSRA